MASIDNMTYVQRKANVLREIDIFYTGYQNDNVYGTSLIENLHILSGLDNSVIYDYDEIFKESPFELNDSLRFKLASGKNYKYTFHNRLREYESVSFSTIESFGLVQELYEKIKKFINNVDSEIYDLEKKYKQLEETKLDNAKNSENSFFGLGKFFKDSDETIIKEVNGQKENEISSKIRLKNRYIAQIESIDLIHFEYYLKIVKKLVSEYLENSIKKFYDEDIVNNALLTSISTYMIENILRVYFLNLNSNFIWANIVKSISTAMVICKPIGNTNVIDKYEVINISRDIVSVLRRIFSDSLDINLSHKNIVQNKHYQLAEYRVSDALGILSNNPSKSDSNISICTEIFYDIDQYLINYISNKLENEENITALESYELEEASELSFRSRINRYLDDVDKLDLMELVEYKVKNYIKEITPSFQSNYFYLDELAIFSNKVGSSLFTSITKDLIHLYILKIKELFTVTWTYYDICEFNNSEFDLNDIYESQFLNEMSGKFDLNKKFFMEYCNLIIAKNNEIKKYMGTVSFDDPIALFKAEAQRLQNGQSDEIDIKSVMNSSFEFLGNKPASQPEDINELIENNDLKSIKELSTKSIESYIEDNKTILIDLIREEKYELAKFFIYKSININIQDTKGETALMEAVIQNNLEIVKLLIENGADVNIKESNQLNSLWLAIYNKNSEIAKVLIENGADVDIVNDGLSPIFAFISYDNFDIVRLIIERTNNLNLKNEDGFTPLLAAISAKKIEIAKLLIDSGVDINLANEQVNSFTPLFLAIFIDNKDLVELLIEKKSNLNHQIDNGKTALVYAAEKGRKDIVELLLNNNADMNITCNHNATALMYSIYVGELDIAKLLIERGIDINIQNNSGQTALDMANDNDYFEIAEILESY